MIELAVHCLAGTAWHNNQRFIIILWYCNSKPESASLAGGTLSGLTTGESQYRSGNMPN